MSAICLFGGSFDPVHNAHLSMAKSALSQLPIAKVVFIPVGHAWQKTRPLSAAKDRLSMLELALQDQAHMEISTIEIERPGPSYTIDTLNTLSVKADDYLLIGSDQLQNLTTWHQWQVLVQTIQLAVVVRPDYRLKAPEALEVFIQNHQCHIHQLKMRETEISSTKIRESLALGQDMSAWIPSKVNDYIQRNGLYLK